MGKRLAESDTGNFFEFIILASLLKLSMIFHHCENRIVIALILRLFIMFDW